MPVELRPAPASSRIAPWHSEEDPFHHNNAECIYADLIGGGERRPGEKGRPLCDLCRRLNKIDERFETYSVPFRF